MFRTTRCSGISLAAPRAFNRFCYIDAIEDVCAPSNVLVLENVSIGTVLSFSYWRPLGSAVGAGNARAAGGSLRARYDAVYAQCMTAKGNRVAAPYVAAPVYVYPRAYWGYGYYYRYGW